MNVLFISDFHLGHRAIIKHQQGLRPVYSVQQHDDWVINQCLSVGATKRTLWYILGDVAMQPELVSRVDELPGRKILIPGNHDLLDTQVYLKHFEKILGGFKKYGMWITHMPLHPLELRDKVNIHGHCHHNTIKDDPRYLNVSIEWAPKNKPVSLDQVRTLFKERGFSI